jgi:hypothetical protein
MPAKSIDMSNLTTTDRYATLVLLLQRILDRLDVIERNVDDIDRALRPYGDGAKLTSPRRRG